MRCVYVDLQIHKIAFLASTYMPLLFIIHTLRRKRARERKKTWKTCFRLLVLHLFCIKMAFWSRQRTWSGRVKRIREKSFKFMHPCSNVMNVCACSFFCILPRPNWMCSLYLFLYIGRYMHDVYEEKRTLALLSLHFREHK